MGKTVRSARGVTVDFDLLKIKEQMSATPKAAPVQARENFIDQRFKRRLNKIKPLSSDDSPPVDPDTADAE